VPVENCLAFGTSYELEDGTCEGAERAVSCCILDQVQRLSHTLSEPLCTLLELRPL
jgi:hypothetical protein